jgi:hypothetical protein
MTADLLRLSAAQHGRGNGEFAIHAWFGVLLQWETEERTPEYLLARAFCPSDERIIDGIR